MEIFNKIQKEDASKEYTQKMILYSVKIGIFHWE